MTEKENDPYNLVHIVSSGEHRSPLIASQLFDRAQAQATIAGPGKPLSVSVWVIVPMRWLWEKESNTIISNLRKRCPDVNIKVIGGINQLNNWPAHGRLKQIRRRLKYKTVYHCRGESVFKWAHEMKVQFPEDAIVLDIRGYFPLERFINDPAIRDENDMSPAQKEIYHSDVKRLKHAIDHSDRVCTVSEPLRKYLIKHVDARENTLVLPCSVKSAVPDTKREAVRKELNIQDKTAILYLGAVHKAQYLEELGIPFIRTALGLSDKYVGVFITQNKEAMQALLTKFQVPPDRYRLLSVPQHEVAGYLTGTDIGLLLRAPSIQNHFSQPVKFGEYLSAGIPVIIEEGTGDLSAILDEYKIGCIIKLWDKKSQEEYNREVGKALDWFEANKNEVRNNTRRFVEERYTWQANIQNERNMYLQALENANKNYTLQDQL